MRRGTQGGGGVSLLDGLKGVHHKLLRPTGGCHNCPRRFTKSTEFVPPTLRKGNIIWVGEGPGETEVEEQEGFTGRSGEKLRRFAENASIDITKTSFTNAVHCRPPNNATPKARELECCLSQFVLEEIQNYPIVVLVGSVPLKVLFPGARASHFRGNVAYHPDFPGQRFYNIYHPAYILRRPDKESEFRQQLERLARIDAGEPKDSWTITQGGGDEYIALLREQLNAPLLSYDLETTSVKPWVPHDQIRSIALTVDAKRVLFAREGEQWWRPTMEAVGAYLQQPQKSVVGAHVAFDNDWMEHDLDIEVACLGIHDVQSIWYQAGQYKQASLKELVSRELDGYRYLIHAPEREQDTTRLAKYNSEDVVHSLNLFWKGIRILKPRTRDLVTRIMGPVSFVLQKMHSSGFHLREEYRQQTIEKYKIRRKEVIANWVAADPAFIPVEHESGKGLHRYLFDIRHLPAISRTEKKGAAAIDKAAIIDWINGGATYLQHLLDIREIDKVESTYLTAYDKHIDEHSRIHSSFHSNRVDSGRTSSSNPNIQNIPRPPEIRNLFGVPDGSILLEADLSQIEFRIMVCRSGDETGIEGYLRGDDAHTMTARNFSVDPMNPTKEERTKSKPINFSLIYGGGWPNVQRAARVDYRLAWSDEQCQEFEQIFFGTYKRFTQFHFDCATRLIQNKGWFESILGHIFYYREWDHPDRGRREHTFRAALNSEAQGPAVHICYGIMVQAHRLFRERGLSDVIFVNHVHDSMLLEIPRPETLDQVIECLEEAVTVTYAWVRSWFVVPLVMDYKVGTSWGSLEDYAVQSLNVRN